jgi:cell wall-associated NlpC family hydrolase
VGYLQFAGDVIVIHGTDGSKTLAYPTTPGIYTPGQNPNVGATPPPPPTTTPTDPPPAGTGTGQQLVDYMAAHAGMYAYGQGPGRLTPDVSGYTDCSGMVYTAYMAVTGQNIGTWGGSQIQNGTLVATGGSTIDTSNLQLGDVVFYQWPGGDPVNYDHTAMYAGNGKVWSHGGPGNGPVLVDITGFVITPVAIMVRRYL